MVEMSFRDILKKQKNNEEVTVKAEKISEKRFESIIGTIGKVQI